MFVKRVSNVLIQFIEQFRVVTKEIILLPGVQHYDLIQLDCEDLKTGLADVAKGLTDRLLARMAADHRTENLK